MTLKNKKGYIIKAYGSINFDTLGDLKLDSDEKDKIDFDKKDKFITNVLFNNTTNLSFDDIDLKAEQDSSFFKRLSSPKIKLDLNNLQKWRFQADKIVIDNQKWSSDELFLTNDPYTPQIIIKNSKFVSLNIDDQIYIKAKWSTSF